MTRPFQEKETKYYQSFGHQSDLLVCYHKVAYYCYSLLLGYFIKILDGLLLELPADGTVWEVPDKLNQGYQNIRYILQRIQEERNFEPPIPTLDSLPYERFDDLEHNQQNIPLRDRYVL